MATQSEEAAHLNQFIHQREILALALLETLPPLDHLIPPDERERFQEIETGILILHFPPLIEFQKSEGSQKANVDFEVLHPDMEYMEIWEEMAQTNPELFYAAILRVDAYRRATAGISFIGLSLYSLVNRQEKEFDILLNGIRLGPLMELQREMDIVLGYIFSQLLVPLCSRRGIDPEDFI